MDKTTLIWAAGIILTIIGALIGVVHGSLRKDVDTNIDDIKHIKERFATKKEVKEVKTDLNEKINRLMDMQNEANKLLHEILLKVGVDHEK